MQNSSQPDITLENRGAASVEDLESSEKQKNKEIQKRSSSTPEIKVSQDDDIRQAELLNELQLREKKLMEKQKGKLSAHETGIPISHDKEDEPSHIELHRGILSQLLVHVSTAEPPNIKSHHSLLSELLTHVPTGGSDYQTSADSVVHNILADILSHIPADERKSGESIARSVLSDLLSHLSSEVATHKVSLDCEYLKEHLGAPLALGLCEVIIKRPVDPIHYLAHWLFKWRWNQKQKQIREEEINALNLERQKKLAELKEKERIEAEQKALIELRKQASEAAVITLETALSQAFELISEEEAGETAAETEEEGFEGAQQ